jgi:hypothetical protein
MTQILHSFNHYIQNSEFLVNTAFWIILCWILQLIIPDSCVITQLVSRWIASVHILSGMLTIFISTLYQAYVMDKPTHSSSRCTSITEVPNGATSHKYYTTLTSPTPTTTTFIRQVIILDDSYLPPLFIVHS